MEQTINDRINLIMEREMLSQAAFAEKLDTNRATLNHILRGRNNPGVQIIQKLISSFPKYSVEWIISGTGNILKDEDPRPDLFQFGNSVQEENSTNNAIPAEILGIPQKISSLNDSIQQLHSVIKEKQTEEKKQEKRISKIYVYYSDNSFEVFTLSDSL
ncbi:MAG: helix-turn-helix domain-containing protein [Porphyromonas sp.]|nr:helix-turn-helix domain-containing protein [Porphyromonas sp.]